MSFTVRFAFLLLIIMVCSSGCYTYPLGVRDPVAPTICPHKDLVPPRHISLTVNDPFYGYSATCWHPWPEGWAGCPPCPAVGGVDMKIVGEVEADGEEAAAPEAAPADAAPSDTAPDEALLPAPNPPDLESLSRPEETPDDGQDEMPSPATSDDPNVPPGSPFDEEKVDPSKEGAGSPPGTRGESGEPAQSRNEAKPLQPPAEPPAQPVAEPPEEPVEESPEEALLEPPFEINSKAPPRTVFLRFVFSPAATVTPNRPDSATATHVDRRERAVQDTTGRDPRSCRHANRSRSGRV